MSADSIRNVRPCLAPICQHWCSRYFVELKFSFSEKFVPSLIPIYSLFIYNHNLKYGARVPVIRWLSQRQFSLEAIFKKLNLNRDPNKQQW